MEGDWEGRKSERAPERRAGRGGRQKKLPHQISNDGMGPWPSNVCCSLTSLCLANRKSPHRVSKIANCLIMSRKSQIVSSCLANRKSPHSVLQITNCLIMSCKSQITSLCLANHKSPHRVLQITSPHLVSQIANRLIMSCKSHHPVSCKSQIVSSCLANCKSPHSVLQITNRPILSHKSQIASSCLANRKLSHRVSQIANHLIVSCKSQIAPSCLTNCITSSLPRTLGNSDAIHARAMLTQTHPRTGDWINKSVTSPIYPPMMTTNTNRSGHPPVNKQTKKLPNPCCYGERLMPRVPKLASNLFGSIHLPGCFEENMHLVLLESCAMFL